MGKLNEFIDGVAKECIAGLSVEEKEYLIENPSTTEQHFELGLYIRNKYIHGNEDAYDFGHPDDISHMILDKIFSILLPDEYGYDDLASTLFSNKKYRNLRKEYKRIYGCYPKEFVQEASKHIEKKYDQRYGFEHYDTKDISDYILKFAEKFWHEEDFLEETRTKGITYEAIFTYVKEIKAIFDKKDIFLPLEISWLMFPEKISKEEYQLFQIKLMSAIDKCPSIVECLNEKYFEDKLIAMGALKWGWTMKYMPMWQNDDEMVNYAIEQGCGAIEFINSRYLKNRDFIIKAVEHSGNNSIMYYEQMKPYRSDREIALIACKVHGWNFTRLCNKLRNDSELAEIAMKNAGPNNVYRYLGSKLKSDRRFALLECESERPDVENFIDVFKDDDEIAEKIIRLHGERSWSLYYMTDRIKDKYGVGRG